MQALNQLIAGKAEIFASYEEMKRTVFSTENLEQELEKINHEINLVDEKMEKLIAENAVCTLDQNIYNQQYTALMHTYDALTEKRIGIMADIKEKQEQKKDVERFLKKLQSLDAMTEFDETIWTLMLNSATVYNDGNVAFKFVDGTEIKIS